MQVTLSVNDLELFEAAVAQEFADRKIPYPVHLSGGSERQLISIFQERVEPQDWVLCTWRSHLHCLLKGVPPERVLAAIRNGRSIALCFPERRVLSSGIVGGTAPIAVGLAMGVRRKGADRKVVCFVGDMAWETGQVQEAVKYSINHKLPVLWIVEDNGLSCCTETKRVWGGHTHVCGRSAIRYEYSNKYPHCGIGKHVQF